MSGTQAVAEKRGPDSWVKILGTVITSFINHPHNICDTLPISGTSLTPGDEIWTSNNVNAYSIFGVHAFTGIACNIQFSIDDGTTWSSNYLASNVAVGAIEYASPAKANKWRVVAAGTGNFTGQVVQGVV